MMNIQMAEATHLDKVKRDSLTETPATNSTIITQDQLQPKEYKSFYKKGVHGDKCMYPNRLDTYGMGCPANCSYCYARCQLDFRNLWFPDNPRIADIVKIEKTIKKIPAGSIVRLGGLTDCFQPLELKERVTFETIKLLNQYRVGYLIVTKSPLVASPEVIEVMDRELAHTSYRHLLRSRDSKAIRKNLVSGGTGQNNFNLTGTRF